MIKERFVFSRIRNGKKNTTSLASTRQKRCHSAAIV